MKTTHKKIRNLLLALLAGLLVGFIGFSLDNSSSPESNQANGTLFLAENGKKDHIITTASGLQYEVLRQGTGAYPSASSRVTVHYRGTTIDGKEFDSSYSRNKPTAFPLGAVIPGWTEGIQLMNIGAKYRFFIPADLAYGERSPSAAIGANASLIFEVELLDF